MNAPETVPERPLEPSRATHETWLRALSAFALDEIDALAAGPSVGAIGAAGLDVAEQVSQPIAEQPLDGGVEAVVALLRRAAGASLVPPGPGYFAYVPGTGLFAAALADLVSDSLNRFTGLAAAAPALCRLEADVIAWLARECGYPPEARGVLLSGSSLANFGAVVTAREHVMGGSGDLRAATVYRSSQAHHCVDKALRLAGIPTANVRSVPVDDQFRMQPAALREAIASDRAAGRTPLLVVASAGTTNTGALDPLSSIADVCAEQSTWFHVDGAYGGAFVLCDAGRRLLAGMERADSIALDPHKGLFLPFGTGLLLVREGDLLRRAHTADAGYLQDFDALDRSREAPSPTEYGPELSRSYRGLRLWLPLMLHGAAAFRDALAEKLDLARRFHAGLLDLGVRTGAALECVAPPQLSTVAFRLSRGENEAVAAWNARNEAFLRRINAGKRVYLSSTMLAAPAGRSGGKSADSAGDSAGDEEVFTLRTCILGARTHLEHVTACLDAIASAIQSESSPLR